MGITKDYLRYVHSGSCGCVGSANGTICAVDATTCAVTACENVNFYNMRTNEKVNEVSESTKEATCMQFSRDNRWYAVGYTDGVIRLFDRKSDEQNSVTFCGHKKAVCSLAFSSDGLTLASGGKDCAVILWDVVSESGLFRLNGHKGPVTHLAFARGDQFLVSSSKDYLIKFWSIKSQSCFYTLFDNGSEVYSFCLLSNDSLLVTACAEAELLVYELRWMEDGKIVLQEEFVEPHKKKADLENSESIVENMANRHIRVSTRGKLLRQCKGRALQIAVSPDERLLLCLGSDRIVDAYRVFNETESSKRLAKKIKSAKKRMASCEDFADINEDDIKKDVTILIARIGEHRSAAKMKWMDFAKVFKLCEDGTTKYSVFALMSNNTVQLLNVCCDFTSNNISFDCVSTLDRHGHRSDIRGLAVSSSNNALVSGGGNELILWNTHSLRPVATLQSDSMENVCAVVFTKGDGYVVAATKTGDLSLWDVAACEMLESRKGHEGTIWDIVHTPDGKQLISVSADKKAIFWSYEVVAEGTRKRLTLRENRILELPDEGLCCAVSPDGKFVAVGLLDSTAAVYFFDTLKFFISLYGHSLPVTCITISPNSKLVVTGSADKSIKIWGLDFGDCHKSFHAHDDVLIKYGSCGEIWESMRPCGTAGTVLDTFAKYSVLAVLFSPSDELLVWSAGRDGKIKQWDARKLCRVQVLDRHSGEVRALAQSDSGNLLFSASHDKSLRCWELTEEIIVVEEEEEMEREKDYEARLIDEEDVVSGETADAEAGLASIKNSQSIVSAENIIEAVDVVRNERAEATENSEHKPHPLFAAYNSKSSDHLIVDVIAKCRPSNLERSLLMVPLSYISDILLALSECVQKHYKVEFAVRVAIFLIRVHQNYIINSLEMLPVLERLSTVMPNGIADVWDITGFNLAALELLQVELEESQSIKLFADVSDVKNKVKKKNKTRKAVIKT